jgi:DNA-binding response OmpR family regulator
MSRRVLVVEPDGPGRAMMDRVLAAEGYAAETFASVHEAQALLDAGAIELAVVDELAGRAGVLEEIRWLRREHPTVPVVVTGALLTSRVLRELLRMHAIDALPKPFTPDELREAVARGLLHSAARHDEAVEYAAAVIAARRAFALGMLAEARPSLVRAQAKAPLDAEVTALWALFAELEGRDEEADRGYRAALALRIDEGQAAPDPFEGLARLEAYAGARPVAALPPALRGAPVFVVGEPKSELPKLPDRPDPIIVLLALGFGGGGARRDTEQGSTHHAPSALFVRLGEQSRWGAREPPKPPGEQSGAVPRAFALIGEALTTESAAVALERLGGGPVLAGESTLARLDLPGIEAWS